MEFDRAPAADMKEFTDDADLTDFQQEHHRTENARKHSVQDDYLDANIQEEEKIASREHRSHGDPRQQTNEQSEEQDNK